MALNEQEQFELLSLERERALGANQGVTPYQDPEIPIPTPPAELAAQAEALRNRPFLEKVGENIRQNTMMGGATDVFNMLASAPPNASVAGATMAGEGAVGAIGKELARRGLGVVPSARAMTRAEGLAAGYKVPASQSGRLAPLGRLIESILGKERVQQAGTLQNQLVSTRIAGQELGIPAEKTLIDEFLGLPGETLLTPGRLEAVREPAYKVFNVIKNLRGTFKADKQFFKDVEDMRRPFSEASKTFTGANINPAAEEIAASLLQTEGGAGYAVQGLEGSAKAMMEMIQHLRDSAKAGFKSASSAEEIAKASAQWQGAKALEGLVERNLERLPGGQGIFKAFKSAREHLAKTEDVAAALIVGPGEISAEQLAQLGRKGYTSGQLDLIRRFREAYPKVTQNATQVGAQPMFNLADVVAGAVGGGVFGPTGLAIGAARPLARGLLGNLALKGQPAPDALRMQALVAAIRAAMGGKSAYDERIGEITNAESP